MAAQQVALTVLAMALSCPAPRGAQRVTPQILAQGGQMGHCPAGHCHGEPMCNSDLLWDGQIQAEDYFLVQVSSVLLYLILLHIPVWPCSDYSGFGHMYHLCCSAEEQLGGWLANPSGFEALS